MFRKVILPGLGVALLVTFVLGMIGGILESNIVQGDYTDKYGTVDVPGSEVVSLPAETINVAYAVLLPGRGNETPDVPVPDNLALTVDPADGGPPAEVRRDVGASENSSAPDTDTAIRLWKVKLPRDARYRVTVRGGSPLAINAQLELGTGPAVPLGLVFAAAAAIGLAAGIFKAIVAFRRRRRPLRFVPTPS
jgi:hypothetical protein